MKTSTELDKLAPALAKAQTEMGGALKDSNNPFFKSKYADLTSVWKACKEALHSNGLSVIQSPLSDNNRIGVATMLLHESGQFVTGEYTIGVKKDNDPQADGSSITYARRYALAAFVGVCPVDDDAEGAMIRGKKQPPKKEQQELSSVYQGLDITLSDFDNHADASAWINNDTQVAYFKDALSPEELKKWSVRCKSYLNSLRD